MSYQVANRIGNALRTSPLNNFNPDGRVVPGPSNFIATEDLDYLMTEDGNFLVTEGIN